MKKDNFVELSLEEKKELLIELKKEIKYYNVMGFLLGANSLVAEGFTIIEGVENCLSTGNALQGDFNIKTSGCVLAFCMLSYLGIGLELEKLHNKSLKLKKDINEN